MNLNKNKSRLDLLILNCDAFTIELKVDKLTEADIKKAAIQAAKYGGQ